MIQVLVSQEHFEALRKQGKIKAEVLYKVAFLTGGHLFAWADDLDNGFRFFTDLPEFAKPHI